MLVTSERFIQLRVVHNGEPEDPVAHIIDTVIDGNDGSPRFYSMKNVCKTVAVGKDGGLS